MPMIFLPVGKKERCHRFGVNLGRKILNAVRAVERYRNAPKSIHWRAALCILGYTVSIGSFGISFQRPTVAGIPVITLMDAHEGGVVFHQDYVMGLMEFVAACCSLYPLIFPPAFLFCFVFVT